MTWKGNIDYLRCSPMFQNRARYDCVLVNSLNGNFLAQLMFMFTVEIGKNAYPFALIHPFNAQRGFFDNTSADENDEELGLHRLHSKPRSSSEFISIRSIICVAVLVPDFVTAGDYIVMDTLDTDMFLRMKEI